MGGIVRVDASRDQIRPEERIALFFFAYLAALGVVRQLGPMERSLLFALPIGLSALWLWESAKGARVSGIVREWGSLALILAGYWAMGLFHSAPREQWQLAWVGWDRMLLDTMGLQSAIERHGRLIPSLLESVYMLLYAIPPLSLGALYLCGRRAAASQYLQVLFLGTFSAYAVLPLVTVISPRIAFPASDLPHVVGLARAINTWILDHMDISTSVFPSGHVAVAFSSAFGLLTAMKERRRIWLVAFAAAFGVYLATIYGRYHYAMDGLASMTIAGICWAVATFLLKTVSPPVVSDAHLVDSGYGDGERVSVL